MALWSSGHSDWKTGPSRPNQKRLWMRTTCGHYNSSKAACSQCGLMRSWAEVVKGVQQTCSTTRPSQPKEEIKALEAALAALPDNVDLFGKVRAPRQQTLGPTPPRMPRRPSTRFQGKKKLLVAQQQAAQAAFGKAEADESRIRAELAELEQQALSQTTQPTCLSDHLLERGSTECCGDRTLPSHASDRSICHTNRSRWSSLPHCPSSVESIKCKCGVFRHLRLGLRRRRFGPRCTRRRLSRHPQARFKRRWQEMLRTVRRRIRAKQCSDVPMGRGGGERVPWL